MCICFADIQGLSPDKQAQLKQFYAQLKSQPNDRNSADNNGSDKALAAGSDTKEALAANFGAKTPSENSTNIKTSDHCAPLKQLVDVANDLKLVADEKNDVTTATNTASHTSESDKRNVNNGSGKALASDTKEATDSGAKTPSENSTNTKSSDHCAPLKQLVDVANDLKLVADEKNDVITATNTASHTSESDKNNVNVSKKKVTEPNQSRKPNSTGGMRCRNAVTETVASPENANSTSVSHKIHTPNISSESESSDEDNGESNVKIPYYMANGKWDYITCDIAKVKKADKKDDLFEVPLQIQTCYQRDGQYQGDVIQETSEFVFVWHFLFTYLFNFLCCPF